MAQVRRYHDFYRKCDPTMRCVLIFFGVLILLYGIAFLVICALVETRIITTGSMFMSTQKRIFYMILFVVAVSLIIMAALLAIVGGNSGRQCPLIAFCITAFLLGIALGIGAIIGVYGSETKIKNFIDRQIVEADQQLITELTSDKDQLVNTEHCYILYAAQTMGKCCSELAHSRYKIKTWPSGSGDDFDFCSKLRESNCMNKKYKISDKASCKTAASTAIYGKVLVPIAACLLVMAIFLVFCGFFSIPMVIYASQDSAETVMSVSISSTAAPTSRYGKSRGHKAEPPKHFGHRKDRKDTHETTATTKPETEDPKMKVTETQLKHLTKIKVKKDALKAATSTKRRSHDVAAKNKR